MRKLQLKNLKKNLQIMRKNNTIDLSLFILIAKIGKTRGLKGEFFLRSFAQNQETLFSFKKFYALSSSTMEEVHFEYMKQSNSNIIAKLKPFNDIDEIKAFGQKDIYILKSELPALESNEVYWFELEGMEIINLEGQHLGLVHEVSNFGANDVLVIKPAKKQLKNILIPFIKNRVIISIEKSKNSILVDWQEDY
jgi:16S rRNA processing protein RimM